MTVTKPRRFKKFVALDRRGNPLWGTLATSADDTKALHDKWNPDPTGEGMGEIIAEASISIKS